MRPDNASADRIEPQPAQRQREAGQQGAEADFTAAISGPVLGGGVMAIGEMSKNLQKLLPP